MSSVERKKIWLKVYKCAMNNLKEDKNNKNLNGWEQLLMD
jgi:hypothetical protein